MIVKASKKDAQAVAALALRLWPDHSVQALTEEFEALAENPEAALFLFRPDGEAAGFAQCQLRHDYVEGTESSPVGYLEGVFLLPAFRGKGHGRELVRACEAWAREMGCREFASDCELSNLESLTFHLHTGFAEANRVICFAKKL